MGAQAPTLQKPLVRRVGGACCGGSGWRRGAPSSLPSPSPPRTICCKSGAHFCPFYLERGSQVCRCPETERRPQGGSPRGLCPTRRGFPIPPWAPHPLHPAGSCLNAGPSPRIPLSNSQRGASGSQCRSRRYRTDLTPSDAAGSIPTFSSSRAPARTVASPPAERVGSPS